MITLRTLFWLALIFPGFWIAYRGLAAADWRDPRLSHAFLCAGRMLLGAGLAVLGLYLVVAP